MNAHTFLLAIGITTVVQIAVVVYIVVAAVKATGPPYRVVLKKRWRKRNNNTWQRMLSLSLQQKRGDKPWNIQWKPLSNTAWTPVSYTSFGVFVVDEPNADGQIIPRSTAKQMIEEYNLTHNKSKLSIKGNKVVATIR